MDFDYFGCFFYEEFDYSRWFAENVNKEFNAYNDETSFDDFSCFFYEGFNYSEKFTGNVDKDFFDIYNIFNVTKYNK